MINGSYLRVPQRPMMRFAANRLRSPFVSRALGCPTTAAYLGPQRNFHRCGPFSAAVPEINGSQDPAYLQRFRRRRTSAQGVRPDCAGGIDEAQLAWLLWRTAFVRIERRGLGSAGVLASRRRGRCPE